MAQNTTPTLDTVTREQTDDHRAATARFANGVVMAFRETDSRHDARTTPVVVAEAFDADGERAVLVRYEAGSARANTPDEHLAVFLEAVFGGGELKGDSGAAVRELLATGHVDEPVVRD